MERFAQPFFRPRFLAGRSLQQLTLAALSLVAASIHAWVVPEHVEEYWLFGAFFVAVALFQVAWAAAVLRRPTAPVLGAGVVVSAAIVGVWLLSRTAGLPVGPEHWEAESVALVDVVAGTAELGLIAAALAVPAVIRPAGRQPDTAVLASSDAGFASGSEAA